ncbi:MAG: hypothetical protein QNJ46_11815 [Leptolyngbyaceae cyanobacterium MO_188.B28]|nr:hypothetical protein [Leptolyngbyaceae cyanobacterium MO_188.B28]
MLRTVKKPLSYLKGKAHAYLKNRQGIKRKERIEERLKNIDITPKNFCFDEFKVKVLRFITSMQVDQSGIKYRYSASCGQTTLYASVYACMTLSLIGDFKKISSNIRKEWSDYFNSFQKAEDGLFYDSMVDNEIYDQSDWWGARHLALHMISAYTDLDTKPAFPFRFLEKYYNLDKLEKWLSSYDWNQAFSNTNDIDNKLMNIGCLLQYQRDSWKDKDAENVVIFLQKYLLEKINPNTGMWGIYDIADPYQRSRMVQFAYHLYPLFFYDRIDIPHRERIVQNVLATQNSLGGFGVKSNSSACEDIDSIDILIRLAPLVPTYQSQIDSALHKAFRWIMCNQVDDGGFVFRLEEQMIYGHKEMSSNNNCGAMFPTWFRCLSLAYMAKYFNISGFKVNSAPGLEN